MSNLEACDGSRRECTCSFEAYVRWMYTYVLRPKDAEKTSTEQWAALNESKSIVARYKEQNSVYMHCSYRIGGSMSTFRADLTIRLMYCNELTLTHLVNAVCVIG